MIHIMLPVQYLRDAKDQLVAPQKRLMLAVLQRVVEDYQGTAYRRTRGLGQPADRRAAHEATAYVANTDRNWPFSFENLCEAIGLDAGQLRRALAQGTGGSS
jgi:hypothetical protein